VKKKLGIVISMNKNTNESNFGNDPKECIGRLESEKTRMNCYEMPPCSCPYCDYVIDMAAPAGRHDVPRPEPGQFSVCLNCKKVLRFGEDLKLFKVDPRDIPDELQQLITTIQIAASYVVTEDLRKRQRSRLKPKRPKKSKRCDRWKNTSAWQMGGTGKWEQCRNAATKRIHIEPSELGDWKQDQAICFSCYAEFVSHYYRPHKVLLL
jgi:hypothetical protein